LHVNPVDIRTVVLAKHALHVVLIHFPIALFITAVAFDYLARAVDAEPDTGRGGLFQSAARCSLDRDSRGDRLLQRGNGRWRGKD
jgi:hypothetical protein